MLLIERLDHRSPQMAAQMLAIMALTYGQEAALMQARTPVPFNLSRLDIQSSHELHLGAFRQERLVGIVALAPDVGGAQFRVSSLVVHPLHQRQGIARALMSELLLQVGAYPVTIATGEGNLPALALYRGLGFVTDRLGELGPEALPLILLRRAATRA